MARFYQRALSATRTDSLRRPDVVIGSSPHPFAALAGSALARRYGVPFVLEIRDLWPQTLIELGRIPRWHPLVAALGVVERILYRRASWIVTVLPRAAGLMVTRGADATRITWIPNGIDLDLVPSATSPSARMTFDVYYVGSHGLANNLDVVLSAAKQLKDDPEPKPIRFCFIGNGPEKARLQTRAETEVIDNVEFRSPVSKSVLFDVLKEADALVMSLPDLDLFRQGGISPNKLFDYMTIGRPVIAALQAPDNPVQKARAGLVSAPEASSIARAVKQIATMSYDERVAMGERARAYVESNFNLQDAADSLLTLLESLTHERVSALLD